MATQAHPTSHAGGGITLWQSCAFTERCIGEMHGSSSSSSSATSSPWMIPPAARRVELHSCVLLHTSVQRELTDGHSREVPWHCRVPAGTSAIPVLLQRGHRVSDLGLGQDALAQHVRGCLSAWYRASLLILYLQTLFVTQFTLHCWIIFFSSLESALEKDYVLFSHKIYIQSLSLLGKKKWLLFTYISLMWILISRNIHTDSITSRYLSLIYRALNHKHMKSKHTKNNPFFHSYSFLFSPSSGLHIALCITSLRRTFLFLICLQLWNQYLLTSVTMKLKI